jgi:hypothetical protein
MKPELLLDAEAVLLKFLTLHPESNLVDIEKHFREELENSYHLDASAKSNMGRTAVNSLIRKGSVLATPCRKEVIKVVPRIVKYGYRNENEYISNTEVPTTVWFTYSVTGPKKNSLIGTHKFGI